MSFPSIPMIILILIGWKLKLLAGFQFSFFFLHTNFSPSTCQKTQRENMSEGNLTKNTKSYDVQLKLMIIGDSTVGKSSLINRFVDGNFLTSLTSTIGVDFKVKLVDIDNLRVRLQIWDTAGQERYRAITSSFL